MRILRETHAISAMTNSTKIGYEGERSGLKHWTEMTEGTWNVLRTSREAKLHSAKFCSPVSPSSTSRMWEKAFIGDDGSQVSRKGLFTVVRTNFERLEPMPFRTQLDQDTRKSGLKRITGDKHHKDSERVGWCLSKWTSFQLFRVQLKRIRDIALRNGTLDRNTVNGL